MKRTILIFCAVLFLVWPMSATTDRQNEAKELVDKASVFCVNGRDYSSKLVGVARGPIAWNGGSHVFETKEKAMITALVQFKLPQPITRDKARELFSSTAPEVQGSTGAYPQVLHSLRGWNYCRRSLLVEISCRCGTTLYE